MIQNKRAYEPPSATDGMRILVDRMWPRGLSKKQAAIDLWLKQVAPSPELRKWFGHDPAKWERFRSRYTKELSHNSDSVETLRENKRRGTVTLVYAARDEKHNNAIVLQDFLKRRKRKSAR
jgi:uncharacterized protein YeaO (DUF488 family)